MRKSKPLLLFLTLVLTLLSVYWGSLYGDFLYDDEFLIQKNQLVQNMDLLPQAFLTSSTYGSGGTDSFYRPLQILSYGLIFQLFGLDPFFFHFFNLCLHIINALLIFILANELLKKVNAKDSMIFSFFGALIWGLHPIQTEAVSYISATADPLHFFFGLLFLLFSIKPKLGQKLLGLFFFLLSLLSKEASVTFPGLLFALLLFKKFTSYEPFSFKKLALNVLPSLLLSLTYSLLRSGPLDFDQSFRFYNSQNIYTDSIAARMGTALAALSDYLKLWFWPSHLQIDRDFSIYNQLADQKVLFGLLICLLCLGALWRIRQWPLMGLLILWFWAYHSLHTGVALPLNSMFLEHWMYVPSVALSLASLWALQFLSLMFKSYSKAVFIGLGLLWSMGLSMKTINQNQVWASPIRLYSHILTGSPNIARVHNNLAMAYSDRGELALAKTHYLKSIEIQDTYPQVRHNLGLLYLKEGQRELGIVQLKKAIEIDPEFYHSYIYLEKVYAQIGDAEKQKFYHQELQKYQPGISSLLAKPPLKK